MILELAPDIKRIVKQLVPKLPFGTYVRVNQIVCMRSFKATGRARARIWSFPRIWQMALKLPPYYVIEVLSHHFDHLSNDDKARVIIHELMHIPKNFSGALIPHRGMHKRINRGAVEQMFRLYKESI